MRMYLLRKARKDGLLFCWIIARNEGQAKELACKDDPVWRESEVIERGIDPTEMIGCKRFEFRPSETCPTCGKHI